MNGDHPTVTDRVAECAQHVEADAYINVQGDEPFIAPAAIDAVSEALFHLSAETLAVNAYAKLDDAAAVSDHNVVKVVVGENGNALMFSRQPIPYPRGHRPNYLRQLGLYGLTRSGLDLFRHLEQGPVGLWHRSWGVVAERHRGVRLRGLGFTRETAYASRLAARNDAPSARCLAPSRDCGVR
jgi:CMP-2-keto-3-deoxyoctulosonic acid synthetase